MCIRDRQEGLLGHDERPAAFLIDMTGQATFGEGYFAITPRIIAAVRPEGAAFRTEKIIPLSDVGAVEMDNRVGGGIVWVETGGRRSALFHYSNASSRRLSAAVKNLNDFLRKRKDLPDAKLDMAVFDEVKDHVCPRCNRPLAQDSNVCPSCTHRGAVVIRLMKYARPYWPQIVFMSALMTLGIVFQLAPPYITKLLVDEVLTARANYALLAPLVLSLVAIRLLQMGVAILRGRTAVHVGASVTRDLRSSVFNHLQRLSLGYFDRQKTGTLMTRVSQDTSRVEHFLVDGVQFTIINVLLLILSLIHISEPTRPY